MVSLFVILQLISFHSTPLTVNASCTGTQTYRYQTDFYNYEGTLVQYYDKGNSERCPDTPHNIPSLVSKEGDLIVYSELLYQNNYNLLKISGNPEFQVGELLLEDNEEYSSFVRQKLSLLAQQEYPGVYQISSEDIEWTDVSFIDNNDDIIEFQLEKSNRTTSFLINYSFQNITEILREEATERHNLSEPIETTDSFYDHQQLVDLKFINDTLYLLAVYEYASSSIAETHDPFLALVNTNRNDYHFNRITTFNDILSSKIIYAEEDLLFMTPESRSASPIHKLRFINGTEHDSTTIAQFQFVDDGYGPYNLVEYLEDGSVGILDLSSLSYNPLPSDIFYHDRIFRGTHVIGKNIILVDYLTRVTDKSILNFEFGILIFSFVFIGVASRKNLTKR